MVLLAIRATLPRRKYLQCWCLEALRHRLQGSQQARHLAATWQCLVDAQGAQQLGLMLVSGVPLSSLTLISHLIPNC